MKKEVILSLLILLFIIGCTDVQVDETQQEPVKEEDNKLIEEVFDQPIQETIPEEQTQEIPNEQPDWTVNDLRDEFDLLINSGSWLDKDHYQRILSDLERLESEGEDVSDLRAKLPELNHDSGSQEPEFEIAEPQEWVPNVMTQPLPKGASSSRLIMPAPLDKIPLTKIGGFGAHSGSHLEGLDHEWIYIEDGTPIGSWGDGKVTQVMDEGNGLIRVFVDYGDGLIGQHMSVVTSLVKEGDIVKAGDPIGYGQVSDWPKGYHFAEFYLLDQHRRDGVLGIYVPNSVAVSPFDYLREDAKKELLDAYQKAVVEPYFEKGIGIDTVWPWEPYLTNPVLIHKKNTIIGEWFLYDKWIIDDIPDFFILLPETEYYNKQKVLASNAISNGIYLFEGDWEVDGNRIIMDTTKGKYYGIYELDESGDRALLKIEYQENSYPNEFSSNALTYIEREALDSAEDGVRLGVLER